MSTSYEEALRCPRCDIRGEHVGEEDRRAQSIRGATILTVYCRNSRCKWYNTSWTIQKNSDGTIPPPLLRREKKFPELPSGVEKRMIEALEEQLRLEQEPGGAELNNPRA
jgi:hypothetical protein